MFKLLQFLLMKPHSRNNISVEDLFHGSKLLLVSGQLRTIMITAYQLWMGER